MKLQSKKKKAIMITLAKGGSLERKVPVDNIRVPDLWHLHLELKEFAFKRGQSTKPAEDVLECWQLCHDLLKHIKEKEK